MSCNKLFNRIKAKTSKGTWYLFAGLISLALLPASLNAAARTASVTGNWSNTVTWGGAAVPTSIDSVTINAGIVVTVDVMNAVSSGTWIKGTLRASRVASSSWSLTTGDILISTGGYLDYGSEADTIPNALIAHIVLSTGSVSYRAGLIVDVSGNFTVRGSTKTPYAFATQSITAATSLTVSGSTSAIGWQLGDQITIGPTSGNGPGSTDSRTITGITNQPACNPSCTVSFSGVPLSRALSSTSPIIVGNLTRNVLVRSSGTVAANSAYILNLAQNATSFSLAQGEFAYLGNSTARKYGITFDGALTKGSISSSTVRNGGYCGITLNPSSSLITLTGNNIYSSVSEGIFVYNSSSNTLIGNNLYSGMGQGIYVYSGSYNTLTGNNLYSNVGVGIYLDNTANNTLAGNTSCSNSGSGIFVSVSPKNTLTGNNLYSN
ncbi:MAG: NosD domain-containing protein, partial [Elusimicrobiota bacterium]|nr:NosD domain-containing protein [Elusimicrobiota bacterium]